MIGFSNHAYFFPHLPVANLRPINPIYPAVTLGTYKVPFPEVIEPLTELYKSFTKETDIYGSRNLLNYPSFRAYVSNWFGFHAPESEHLQLHPEFAKAVMYVFYKNHHE